ncbi:MAG: cell division protein FtsA [bacterium]
MMSEVRNPIFTLDIGTSKICALVCEPDVSSLRVIGVGIATANGLKDGNISSLEELALSINRAVSSAEQMSGVRAENLYIGINSSHLTGLDNLGMITLPRSNKEFTNEDIKRVMEAAKTVDLPDVRVVIDILPQEYILDGQSGVKNPIGMTGKRLEVVVYIVTCDKSFAVNLIKAVEKAGYSFSRLVPSPIAVSSMLITPNEKEMGVVVIDIGGYETSAVVYFENKIANIYSSPLGSEHLTRDLSIGLRVSPEEAEQIKISSGCVYLPLLEEKEIEVSGSSNRFMRKVSIRKVYDILGARLEEMFGMILVDLNRNGYGGYLAGGIILTGGGSKIKGAVELAEDVFDMPAKLGRLDGIEGIDEIANDPVYYTSIAIADYIMRRRVRTGWVFGKESYRNAIKNITGWFKGLFKLGE